MLQLNSLQNEQVQLDVFECGCGFHIGLDSSYLEQVEDVEVSCPSCDQVIDTSDG